MHEPAVTEVDAHVRGFLAFLVEEHQIAFDKVVQIDFDADFAQRKRVAWKRDADLAEAVMDQAAAIKAVGIDAAVAIRRAYHRQRVFRRAVCVRVFRACQGSCRRCSRRRGGAGRKREYDTQYQDRANGFAGHGASSCRR